MIIEAIPKQDKEVIGDITEFKTSIDPKNLEFITTLLSSNLYSAPEKSFIREIVSNAWDAQVEAGTTSEPVIISMKNKEVSIRDFGTGISPERFREIYCNIGSSTKRDSNDYIGGFGLGRFSALSCSDTVFIDSFYEGTQYSYVMIKDGNAITINLIFQQATTEANGVQVSIKNIDNMKPYYEALRYILFFPNVYVDSSYYSYNSYSINNHKIHRYNHYACANVVLENMILLGNVLYPIDLSFFSGDCKAFMQNVSYSGFVLSFDVGELEITPNRENLIYSSSTIQAIEKKVKLAKQELFDAIESCFQKDYNSFASLYLDYGKHHFDPLNCEVKTYSSYRSEDIFFPSDFNRKWVYNGVEIDDEDMDLWKGLLTTSLPDFRMLMVDGRVYTSKIPNKYEKYLKGSTHIDRIIIDKNIVLTSTIKKYLMETYSNVLVLFDYDVKKIGEGLLSHPLYEKSLAPHKNLIAKTFTDYLYINGSLTTFNPSSSDFVSFKEALKEEKAKPKEKKDNTLTYFLVYEYYKENYHVRHTISDVQELISRFKNKHSGIVLVPCSSPYIDILCSICAVKGYTLYTSNMKVVKAIEKLRLSNMVSADYLLHEDPQLAIINTYEKYKSQIYQYTRDQVTDVSYKFYDTLPDSLRDAFKSMWQKILPYDSIFLYVNFAKEQGKTDPYIEHLLQLYIKYYTTFLSAYRMSPSLVVYIGAAIMKMKGYRIPYKLYNLIKNDIYINLLCQKNSSNSERK